MARRIQHGRNEIVLIESHETIPHQCDEGDIAVSFYNGENDSYRVTFVGKNKQLDSWESQFSSVEEAIGAIKCYLI